MPGKLIMAVLLRLLNLYERRNVVYSTDIVPTHYLVSKTVYIGKPR